MLKYYLFTGTWRDRARKKKFGNLLWSCIWTVKSWLYIVSCCCIQVQVEESLLQQLKNDLSAVADKCMCLFGKHGWRRVWAFTSSYRAGPICLWGPAALVSQYLSAFLATYTVHYIFSPHGMSLARMWDYYLTTSNYCDLKLYLCILLFSLPYYTVTFK